MTRDPRPSIVAQLRILADVQSDDALMDIMQDRGRLVSDCAVHLGDVPTSDLLSALTRWHREAVKL